MTSLFCMMVDCGTEGLKIAPRATAFAAALYVCRTGSSVNFRQHFAAPELVEPVSPRLDFELIIWLAYVRQIDGQDVGTIDALNVPP